MGSPFKIGDRVRMVQTADSVGTVASDVFPSPLTGGPRQLVKWDRTGKETEWAPAFLRPADTDHAFDPDEVVFDNARRSRGRAYTDKFGMVIVIQDGFSRAV